MPEFAHGTEFRYTPFPFRMIAGARVMCADGKVRTLAHWGEYGNNCALRVRGKYIRGHVSAVTASGLSTATEDDPAYLYFYAYQDQPFAHLLSEGYHECMKSIGAAMMKDHYELWRTLPIWMIG